MYIQIGSCFGKIAVGLKEASQRADQITLLTPIMFNKAAQRFLLETPHRIKVALFQRQQQLKQLEVAIVGCLFKIAKLISDTD